MSDLRKATEEYSDDVSDVMDSKVSALVELMLGDLLMIASQLHAMATCDDLNKLQVLELVRMARYLLMPVEASFPKMIGWRKRVEQRVMRRFVSN